ncbi:unnamed protein product [Sphagnum tenellum]
MNEFQAAYEISRLTQEYPRQKGVIDQHVAAGKFVLAFHAAQYCRYTDACLGVSAEVVSVYDTRAEADAACDAREDDNGGDFYYMVYPPARGFLAVLPDGSIKLDECPF